MLAINARFRNSPQTGVQRVAAELAARLDLPHVEIAPGQPMPGLRGHGWEQAVLAARAAGRPLWSPCNTGPVAIRRQVVTIHDAAVFDHPEWFSRAFAAAYRLLLPALAARVARIVTVSAFSRRRLAAALGLPEARIAVVPNGVSPAFAPPAPEAMAAAAAPLGVEPGRYFATLSTLEPRKNLPLVLAAFERARPALPSGTRLVLIGGGGAAHIFKADGRPAAEAEGVVRAGFVPDAVLPALLGGAIALVYPSRYEGFGLPLVEAMACGTPVIAATGSCLEEVGGDAALYVDPDDAAALAAHMVALAREPRRRADLSAAAIERAALFPWDHAAGRMRDILISDLALDRG